MRIGVYAPRRSSFPIVAPPAMEAIKRGHEVMLLTDPAGAQTGDVWLEREARRDLPGTVGVRDVRAYRGDWVLGARQSVPLFETGFDVVRGRIQHVVSLEPWLDSLAMPYTDSFAITHRTMRHGLISTDAVSAVTGDVKEQIAWFLPKTRVPGLVNKAARYATMFVTGRVLERACRQHGCELVLKTRRKIRVPRFLRHHQIIGEERLYPADAIRLIATSRLVVCHHSSAAIEAAALGVPCLNIRVPIPHLRQFPQHALMTMRTNSPMAWKGVVDAIPVYRLASWMSGWSSDMTASKPNHQTYLDTWLGGTAQGASAWVLDRMEER